MIIGQILSLVLSAMSLLSFLLGAGLAGIGIFLMASKDLLRSVMNLVDTSKLPPAASGSVNEAKDQAQAIMDKYDIISTVGIAFLIVGAFIAGVSFCGGIGAMCKLRILLLVYIIVTGTLFVALLVGLIYFGSLKARMTDEILKKLTQLQEEFFISLIELVKNPSSAKGIMTMAINFMHIKLMCCGVNQLGDARNSSSWLGSERSVMAFSQQMSNPIAVPNNKDMPDLHRYPADAPAEGSGKNLPTWLKEKLPTGIQELPEGVKVPMELPKDFSLPPDFKDQLKNLADKSQFTKEALMGLLSKALTMTTPLTCCRLTKPDDLLKGNYDVKTLTNILVDKTCPFSAKNDGINQKTCYKALLDYISYYQKYVVTVGTVLAIVMGVGVGCALWIFLFD